MKKVERIICSLIFVVSINNVKASTFNVNTTTFVQDACVDWALDMVDWVEEDGCLDAETATALYNAFYDECQGM